MAFDLVKASDVSPAGEIRLGGTVYPVPPMTFARFQELLKLPVIAMIAAGEDARTDAEKVFCGMALIAPSAFVPGVPAEAWTDAVKMEVALMILPRHQWSEVLDFIRFGQPPDEGEVVTTPGTLNAAILGFCQANPYYRPEQFMALPFDLAYGLLAAQKELTEMRAEPEESETGTPDGFGRQRDPERAAALDALMSDARRVF